MNGGIKFLMQMLYQQKLRDGLRNPYTKFGSLGGWFFFLTPGNVGIRTLPRIYGQIVLRYCLGDFVFCLPMNLVEQPSQFSDINNIYENCPWNGSAFFKPTRSSWHGIERCCSLLQPTTSQDPWEHLWIRQLGKCGGWPVQENPLGQSLVVPYTLSPFWVQWDFKCNSLRV